jgi:hypothetical protein
MRIAALAAATATALMIFTASIPSAMAVVRIKADPGGQIGPYLETLVALRSSGERVIIDGPCISACTLVLGVIPRDRICVTTRARLGFHAAWHPGDDGRPVTSRAATQLLRIQNGPRPSERAPDRQSSSAIPLLGACPGNVSDG